MSSPDHQASAPQPTPASPAPAGAAPAGQKQPVTVVCPTGFTKSSMVGVDPKKPLYARVTYWPT